MKKTLLAAILSLLIGSCSNRKEELVSEKSRLTNKINEILDRQSELLKMNENDLADGKYLNTTDRGREIIDISAKYNNEEIDSLNKVYEKLNPQLIKINEELEHIK